MIRLLYVYIVCFTFGALYSLISAVLGTHHPGSGDGSPADADGGSISDIAGHNGIDVGNGIDTSHGIDAGNGIDAGHIVDAGHSIDISPGGIDAGHGMIGNGGIGIDHGLDTGHSFNTAHSADAVHAADAANGNADGTGSHATEAVAGSTGEKVNPSPFNTTVIFSSVAAFGGVGLIGKLGFSMSDPASALLAFICSALIGTVIFFGVVKLIYNSQSNTAFSGRELIGSEAEVNIPIPANGLGVIVCVIRGTRHTISARSRNGARIGQGEKVRIREMNSNVALVSRKIAADEYDFDKMKETGKSRKYN